MFSIPIVVRASHTSVNCGLLWIMNMGEHSMLAQGEVRRSSYDPPRSEVGYSRSRLSLIIRKWHFYSARYGRVSACLRYMGRCYPRMWPIIGRFATASYLARWRRTPGTKLLNLGGGGNVRYEWLTADMDPRADVFIDCTRVLPFATCSVDGVMLEEVVEHLDFQRGLHLLKECHRVLKNDGVLRLSTPDFAWFANLQSISESKAGDQRQRDFVHHEGRRYLGSGDLPEELLRAATLNQIFLSHGHRFVYTAQSLESLLFLAGFQCSRSSYGDVDSKLGALETHADRFGHPPEILMYYEACKRV